MIQIQSLGGIDLRDAEGVPVRLRSRKHVALLLYLAASDRRSFPREHLAELIWDTPPERARHSLSQAVYDIRNHADGVLDRAPGDQLAIDPTRLRLDVSYFETAVREGRLREAVELYRGPFAPSLVGAGTREFDRWLDAERVRLRRLAEAALRRHVVESESKGLWGEMCVSALKLVDMVPLDEDAHRALMRGLWLHGDPAAALEHYEMAIELLRRDSGTDVSRETHDLARKIRAAPLGEPIGGGSAERDVPIVGRDAEFDTLRAAMRDIGRGRGTAVLVAGEAGIGKSRLLREFRRSLALEDVRLIESRCYPGEEDLPYGPVIEGLAPIASEVLSQPDAAGRFPRLGYLLRDTPNDPLPEDQGVDPSAWRRRLYEEVATLLRLAAETRPIVWTIDDVQWMDSTSASLFHYVSRRLQGSPFLLVVTMRAPRSGKLPARLPVTPPDGSGYTTEIRLQPLADEQIEALLLHGRSEGPDHPALQMAKRLSAGNPFYALEVFLAALSSQDWAESARAWDPLNDERLRRVLAVRFKGLPPEANRILQSAAVLERNATPRILAEVSGVDLDAAADDSAELYARGIIFDDANRIDFINDLMREYVYAEMSGLRRTALHRRAALTLEREPDATPGRLARHFLLGDERERAYRYAMEAARLAAASRGHAEAASMAGLAREAAATLAQEIPALDLMAESELASAQLASAREHLADVLRLQPDLPPEDVVRIKLKMVTAEGAASNWSNVLKLIREIGPNLRRVSSRVTRLELRVETAVWGLRAATRLNDVKTAKRFELRIRRLRERAATAGAMSPTLDTLSTYAMAAFETFCGSLGQAKSLLKYLASLETVSDSELRYRVPLLQSSAYLRDGNWDASEHFGREAHRVARAEGDLVHQATALNNLACGAMEHGEWDKADSYFAAVEKLHTTIHAALDATLPLLMNRANLHFYRGEPALARELYLECRRITMTQGISEFNLELQACVGLTSLQIGDARSAGIEWTALATASRDVEAIQERFKVEWFRSYMLHRAGSDDEGRRLQSVSREYADSDVLQAAKLRWLGALFEAQLNQTPKLEVLERELQRAGLRWFCYFTKRWVRSANAILPATMSGSSRVGLTQ